MPQEAVVNGAPKGPRMGDIFVCSRNKDFLDHRDSDGNTVDMSYLGGEIQKRSLVKIRVFFHA